MSKGVLSSLAPATVSVRLPGPEGSAGLGPSALELRDMFREGARASEAMAAGVSSGHVFSLFGEEEEDLGDDYEEKKRIREVRGWMQGAWVRVWSCGICSCGWR